MPRDAFITLEQLRCIRESDGTGHSEPYIWPAIVWIDDNTISTPGLVGMTSSILEHARVVIKDDMRARQVASIPASVGSFRIRFEDNLDTFHLFIVVALWEEDETPNKAMRAGFQVFAPELRAAVRDNLLSLNQASEEERAVIIESIKDRVRDKVKSAISDGLTGWQKVRVGLGTLNLDDIVASTHASFDSLQNRSFTMTFRSGTDQHYEIDGSIRLRPVVLDRCQALVDAVQAAQGVVNGVEAEIEALQEELQNASPGQKPFLIQEIKRLQNEDLVQAMEALDEARQALLRCRNMQSVVVLPEVLSR